MTQTLAQVLPPEREGHFQTRVVNRMHFFGWRVYHPWLSVHSASGWPDLFAVRGERAIAAELKTDKAPPPRPSQQAWLDELGAVPGIESYCWRPRDMDWIERILR